MTAISARGPLRAWWTPWGIVLRLARVVRAPSDLYWIVRIGWFVWRVPGEVQRRHLGELMDRLSAASRPRARGALSSTAERIIRLRTPWLRFPPLRNRDTCYVRALTLYRFLDPGEEKMRLRIAAEWFDRPGGVLRGHAWVTVDDEVVEPPAGADDHSRLQLIDFEPRSR